MTAFTHTSVMTSEVLEGLNLRENNAKKKQVIYVDATFGRGGHSRAILACLGENASVYAMDRDPDAAKVALQLEAEDPRFHFQSLSFSHLTEFCRSYDILGKVNGILLDLGVSSPQLEDASRGFSFQQSGALDMRMDPRQGFSARDWINHAELTEIQTVLKEYGEERYAKRIATAIVSARLKNPIETTTELAEIIAKAHPAWEKHKHPATRSFQAIRIFINQELQELSACLQQSLSVLAPSGRLVVISFHSLEDRIVKRFIQTQERDAHPRDLPIQASESTSLLKRIGRKQKASEIEVTENRRARSAVLRVAERLGNNQVMKEGFEENERRDKYRGHS